MNVPSLRNHHGLSEREAQILDGLVKGHANKVIARTCEIAEATVKVHMKSILRKIRVDNRTQAAIWAMANGYAADGSNGRRLNPDSARNAAAITEAAIRSVATSAMNLAPQLVTSRSDSQHHTVPRASAGHDVDRHHRTGFRLYWRWKSHGRGGRPRIPGSSAVWSGK